MATLPMSWYSRAPSRPSYRSLETNPRGAMRRFQTAQCLRGSAAQLLCEICRQRQPLSPLTAAGWGIEAVGRGGVNLPLLVVLAELAVGLQLLGEVNHGDCTPRDRAVSKCSAARQTGECCPALHLCSCCPLCSAPRPRFASSNLL